MKRCSKCKQDKDLADFNLNGRMEDGRQRICRVCQHDYYIRNRERHIANVKKTKEATYKRNRSKIEEAKDVPCGDCGVRYPAYVMDFDHVRGEKFRNVSQMGFHCSEKLEFEIDKCEVVCSNCHRERTHARHAPVAERN